MEDHRGEKKRVSRWEDLDVWKAAHRMTVKVYDVVRTLPSDEKWRLSDQLCRAAISVPTNIAEGKGRASTRDYLNFLTIARGSVEETKYLVLLARDLHYLSQDSYGELRDGYDQVGRMLNGLMRSLRIVASRSQNPAPNP